MIKRLVAGATALSLFLMPATAAFARPGQASPVSAQPSEVAGGLEFSQAELVRSVAGDMLVDEGYTVGLTDVAVSDALLRSFGAELVSESLAVTLPVTDTVKAVVLIPVDSYGLMAGGVPMTLFNDDGRYSSYVVDFGDDHLLISRPDGEVVVDAPVYEKDGIFRVELESLKIFAVDIPIDFSLDPLIAALQQVLDLLYTVKGLINSIICAVQSAVDLLYGLDNCGIGTTTVGGGAILSRVQCSAPKVKNFINTLQNYCF